ncbi:hypothetical protein V6K52_10105 [Knoellia sp. S7-12]|uniref:hypothetical protein n=1 Tax=Knoellia sp. S7-12 TaxID=3126698 RepID=UPI0033666772
MTDFVPPPRALHVMAGTNSHHIAAEAIRRRGHHPPSPRRDRYARHPATLLEDARRRSRVERAYSRFGSLEVCEAVLVGLAREVSTRRRVDSPKDALHSREWARVVVEADLAAVADAVHEGWLEHTPDAFPEEPLNDHQESAPDPEPVLDEDTDDAAEQSLDDALEALLSA